jgi:hypothetical protein
LTDGPTTAKGRNPLLDREELAAFIGKSLNGLLWFARFSLFPSLSRERVDKIMRALKIKGFEASLFRSFRSFLSVKEKTVPRLFAHTSPANSTPKPRTFRS